MITEKTNVIATDKPVKPGKSKKWIVIAGIILIIASFSVYYYYTHRNSKDIKTILIKKQDMKDILDISGTVVSEHDVNLKAVSTGIIVNIFVKENNLVNINKPLLVIDPQQIRLQLNQAKINSISNRLQAETALVNSQKTLFETKARHKSNVDNLTNQIDKAESNVKFLENELKRNISLLSEGAINKQTLDNQQQQLNQAKIDLKTAEDNLDKVSKDRSEIVAAQNGLDQAKTVLNNAIKQGDATISIAQDSLQRTILNSPFKGTITSWLIDQGDFVAPGTPLGKLQDLDDIRLVLPVNELDLPKINFLNQVEIVFDAYPDKKFKGKISWIGQSSVADIQNVQNFPVKVNFENPRHLIKPGMSGDARITVSTKKNIIAVPLTDIHKKENKIFVNILENNKVKEVEIQPGNTTLDFLEVKKGLNVGDQLVSEVVK